MLRTILWYSCGWSFLVITYPMLWLATYYKHIGKKDKNRILVDRMTGRICRVLFYLTGSKIKITGLENVPEHGAVLFVSNHQGHADSLVIHGFINKPKGFVSVLEALKLPIINQWMEQMACVFINREDARQSTLCFNKAVDYLINGHSMVVFPEGRLSDGEEANDFKKGWLKLATKSGVPIVPISMNGSYKVLAKNGSRVKADTITCVISKPISINHLKKADEAEFIQKLRDTILENIASTL
ncbi:1-acyl-sn-glycerol-3-phosphate acyltransferase [Dehalobacter sp. DCM]|uniref:lysophospholipid acyltransferase family protein n=1 Tax=Dehalobacter sp. DCM TaxID=2907827 RepID=UPI0030818B9C|nr:1-acyl-sn-glycerol-3-phosphate acyltransferase [Dehalobacter sp. DCM]